MENRTIYKQIKDQVKSITIYDGKSLIYLQRCLRDWQTSEILVSFNETSGIRCFNLETVKLETIKSQDPQTQYFWCQIKDYRRKKAYGIVETFSQSALLSQLGIADVA